MKCIHCLNEFSRELITNDHVLPRSWYPDNTDADLNRWTAPSCRSCNHELGTIEQSLGIRIGFCLDPEGEETTGLYQRSLRSIDPRQARDERDARAREARGKEIFQILVPGDRIFSRHALAGFEPHEHMPRHEQIVVPLPVAHVERICEKMTRGVIYIENGTYIEPPFRIEQFHVRERGDNLIVPTMHAHGIHLHQSHTMNVRILRPVDAPEEALIRFRVWDKWTWYSQITQLDDP
jgi:hypothetical protein